MARLGKGDEWLRGLPPVFQHLCANAVAFSTVDPAVVGEGADYTAHLDVAMELCLKVHVFLRKTSPNTDAVKHAVEGAWRCFDVLNYRRCYDPRARRAAACHFVRAAVDGASRRPFIEAALASAQKAL